MTKSCRCGNHKRNSLERNGQWQGDKVKYNALHDYIKYHLPKSENCQDCGKKKTLELANISQKYKRDLTDWEWLCRTCHMTKDGRIEKLQQNADKWRSKTKMFKNQYGIFPSRNFDDSEMPTIW